MSFSRLRVLLLTLVLASVALWIANQQTQSTIEEQSLISKPFTYSWQAKETTVWKINPQEPAKQTIIHAQNIHYQDALKKSEFSSPDIQVIDKNTLTKLSSQTGESLNDQTVIFTGNVVIKQNPIQTELTNNSTNPKTILTTTSLSYDTQSNQLYSDEKITIKQYNTQTSGTGLKADLNKSEFELLSDVKSTYYPQKTSQPIQTKDQ